MITYVLGHFLWYFGPTHDCPTHSCTAPPSRDSWPSDDLSSTWCVFADRKRATNKLKTSIGYWFFNWNNLVHSITIYISFSGTTEWYQSGFWVIEFLTILDDVFKYTYSHYKTCFLLDDVRGKLLAVSSSSKSDPASFSKQWPKFVGPVSFFLFFQWREEKLRITHWKLNPDLHGSYYKRSTRFCKKISTNELRKKWLLRGEYTDKIGMAKPTRRQHILFHLIYHG